MNNLTYKLGFGLAGKLSVLKKKYKGNKRIFDYTKVFIFIDEYNGKNRVCARCNCNDIFAQGLGNSSFITIYESRKFKSQIEAEAHLEKQINFATKKFNGTNFYLHKKVDFYENGKLINNVWGDFIYENSKWKLTENIPSNPICKNCGTEISNTENPICGKCGEIII